jgi:hypothetical protein
MMAGKFSNMRYVPGTSRGSQSDTAECAERVEAMLSTAILQQEDICNLLLLVFPDGNNTFDGAVDCAGRSSSAMVEVPPEFLMAWFSTKELYGCCLEFSSQTKWKWD